VEMNGEELLEYRNCVNAVLRPKLMVKQKDVWVYLLFISM